MPIVAEDLKMTQFLCPGCRRPLSSVRDVANAGADRGECITPLCAHQGRRLTASEWAELEAATHAALRRTRPTWDEQFAEIATIVAKRGTCDRSQVGCVITVANRMVATGYNGAPAGASHCDDVGHLMEGKSCVRTVHAEANAIADAARRGVSVQGGTAYLTRIPCLDCAKLLVSAGIVRVVAAVKYRDPAPILWLFEATGVRLEWPEKG